VENLLSESLYFAVSKLHRNIVRIADATFKEVGLAPSYAMLLMLLHEWKVLSPTEISNSLDISPSTTTRFIDKLVKQKLVERRFEGIYSYISLTTTGQQKIPEIMGLFEEMEYQLQHLVTKTKAIKVKPQLLDMATAIQEHKKS
jgi:DNA-binding MarR family transcriptional regulator